MIAQNPDLLWTCPPRRPRSPWLLTALLLFGLLCWLVGERRARGEPGSPPPPPPPETNEPRVHRVLQAPAVCAQEGSKMKYSGMCRQPAAGGPAMGFDPPKAPWVAALVIVALLALGYAAKKEWRTL